MRRVQFTPAAQADLDGIWSYTVDQWGELQAIRYIRDIQATCVNLASGRQEGRSAEKIRLGYFKARSGSHVVFYRLTDETLVVVRILHQKMDVDRHL